MNECGRCVLSKVSMLLMLFYFPLGASAQDVIQQDSIADKKGFLDWLLWFVSGGSLSNSALWLIFVGVIYLSVLLMGRYLWIVLLNNQYLWAYAEEVKAQLVVEQDKPDK